MDVRRYFKKESDCFSPISETTVYCFHEKYGGFMKRNGFKGFAAVIFSILIISIADVSARSRQYEKNAALRKAKRITSSLIRQGMTDFEKVLVIHEYITERVRYGKYKGETSAYTALIYNQADCVGFARSLDLLLRTAGLDSFVVVRRKGHLWVKVKLHGKYYNIDPTWCALKSRWPQYSWFLLSDEQNVANYKALYHVLDSGESYTPAEDIFVFRKSDYLNKQLLRSRSKIRVIGEVSVPDGTAVPSEGIIGYINGNRFKIPKGEKSAFFITQIKRNSKQPFLQYQLRTDNVENIAKSGYYSANGAVLNKEDATKFNLKGLDLTGVEFVLKESANFLKGRISLPASKVAPAGGLYFSIELTCYRGNKRVRYYDRVYIPKGENAADYRIDISEKDSDRNFYLYYYSPKAVKFGYQKVGYYSDNGTVTKSSVKSFFKISGKKDSVDLQISQ